MVDRYRQVPVAVVGVGALLPGEPGSGGYWRTLVHGRDLMVEVPPTRWLVEDHYDPDPLARDKTYAKRGAFLPAVDFDPAAYGVPPRTIEATDSSQLLALLVAEQVLGDLAGTSEPDRERVSVVLGAGGTPLMIQVGGRSQRPVWVKALRESGVAEPLVQEICERISGHYPEWREATFPGGLANVIAGRIANRFDFHGTNHVTDAACASSFAALSTAVSELSLGRADLVLSGGVDTYNNVEMYLCFSKTPALSLTGDCRPFAADADGTMLGEGVAMYALKRLEDAERDCDHVYAVIRGIGTSSDGRGSAIYTPTPQGQARALRRAYQEAGYGPDTVELVEAHGTGTRAGDAAEFAALREVFAESGRDDEQWCALGSVKSQIGHTKATAGAAGLLKAVFALHHRVLPPSIKVERPNPELGLDGSPFHLNTAARPWVRAADHPRRASVSSFGFGGTNFHVTLEEYAPSDASFARRAPRARAVPTELVLISAPTARALTEWTPDPSRPLADTARESQRAFDPGERVRLAVVASDTTDLADKLAQVAAVLDQRPDTSFSLPGGVHCATGEPRPGRIAFLFPGQGSQHVGMGADLAMHSATAQAVWDELGSCRFDDRALHRVVFPPPAFTDDQRASQHDLLTATEWAQPALAVGESALLAVLRGLGLEPDHVAGHSFGELTALHAAGVLDAASLVRLARARGEAMRDAAADAPGAMTAVTATRAEVDTVLESCGGGIWLANHNGPDQFVLSGTTTAIEAAEGKCAAQGITTRRLDASTAFHSPLVAAAARRLERVLGELEIGEPRIPVHGNEDAAPYPTDPEVVRSRIAGHLAAPVLFDRQVEALYEAGVRTFVEVGPGTTLTGLVERILADREHAAVAVQPRGRDGVTGLHDALGRLAVRGVPLDFDELWREYDQRTAHADTPTPALTVPIDGGNRGLRYPPEGGAAALPAPNPPREETPVTPQQPVPPPASSLAAGPAADSGWLAAIESAQRHTAEAHTAVHRMLVESHQDFLRASEATFAALLTAQGVGNAASPTSTAPVPTVVPPVAEPAVAFTMPPAPTSVPAPVSAAESSSPPGIVLGSLSPEETADLVLSVVADRTGYPVEVLDLDMELEADLGIDSIKRVEILASFRDQVGELAEGDIAELGALRTLREVIDRINGMAVAGGAVDAVSWQAVEPVADHVEPVADHKALGADPREATRLAVRMVPVPAPDLSLAGVGAASFVVLDGGSGLADEVVAELNRHGVTARVADRVPDDATGVVHLAGLAAVGSPAEALARQREVFTAARVVAERFTTGRGVFVTVQDTGGDFGTRADRPERAWLGGVAALARTAAAEWPTASVKAIDCERGDRSTEAVAAAIVAELLRGGGTPAVGLRADGTRLVPTAVPAPVAPGAEARITEDSVVVATGGGRGVTAAALRRLAETHRPKLVLIGRTEPADEPPGLADAADEAALTRALAGQDDGTTAPKELARRARRILAAREVRATLAALERAGSPVRYLAVDVRDEDALTDALAGVRREWGPITGLVHGAGVVADKRIVDKTDAQYDHVLDTKVGGLRALLAATRTDPLDLVVLFSSVVAATGNPGQSDYAAANEVLNHVASAEQAERPDALVRAIAWGPWDGGMVTPALARHFDAAGVPLLATDAGAEAFTRELAAGGDDTRVVVVASPDLPAPPAAPAEARVTGATHPHLVGLDGLPPAQALTWLAGAAVDRHPGHRLALRDFRVLGGVPLSRLDLGGHVFTAVRAGDHLELRDDDHVPVFSAEVATTSDSGFAPVPDDVREQSDDPRTPGWPRDLGPLDAAAVDGALRLAARWAESELDGAARLLGIAEIRADGPGRRKVSRCVVHTGRPHGAGTRCDVVLLSDDGAPVVELLGVEFARRQG
ncbi:acyl transferase domain-containing protein [Saccharothrix tamanrassetensis]|uniref:Acyl transferase domain-containing protein n=1 Tax=Saccharothrix tamanrassetensis TaxID=1051531 RepID=A0A841CLS8_9PSEU|nr:type I polyketide synthase [Saccharothrix tamanrassetensis]MBB5957324.1 acyl transferase domain-containing protein [Saccharothrix tamanrassetensis]